MLEVSGLEVRYGHAAPVLRGVSVEVPDGSIVALLGRNGAGKTTTLRAVSGLLRSSGGRITAGSVRYRGRELTGLDASLMVRAGVTHCLEGRRIFRALTVEENLRAGAITVRDSGAVEAGFERVMALFPVLQDRRRQAAGYLSGGEQQMLAIGRSLMSTPSLLLLDEPSLGLAPKLIVQIRDLVAAVAQGGTSVLLVEQNARMALSLADHAYVIEDGTVQASGSAAELSADDRIAELYLGSAAGARPGAAA